MNEPSAPADVTQEQQAAYDELIRERDVRSRLYPRWVDDGRLTPSEARDRFDRLNNAIKLLLGFLPKLVTSSGDKTQPF